MTPHKCPVCDGSGKRKKAECPACKGACVLWSNDEEGRLKICYVPIRYPQPTPDAYPHWYSPFVYTTTSDKIDASDITTGGGTSPSWLDSYDRSLI